MDKYKNKFRISSSRLQNWDYGWNAPYFVTICTANRECYLGEIQNNEMILSEIGFKANEFWLEIPEHFPFVKLDEFVVMPNHVHGIIIIDKPDDGRNDENNDKQSHQPKPQSQTAAASQKWKPGTLGAIINQYKRICTIESRKINPDFAWQSRFHDHIIRNNAEYQRIKNYIINNPQKWKGDKFYND